MKKIHKLFIASFVILLSLVLTGCTKTVSFTYKVETGDTIKVELKTDDKYKLSSKVPFTISKDDKTLSTGTFLTNDGYKTYENAIDTGNGIEVFEEKDNKDISYTFFSVNDKQFVYLIKVKDSNTGIFLENKNSKEEAKEIFDMLTFTLEK